MTTPAATRTRPGISPLCGRVCFSRTSATAAAGGYSPREEAMAQMISSLTERGSAGTASMFRDMARNGRTEHEHVIGDMLARARTAGVPAPLLRLSLANMQAYEAQRSATAAG